MASLVLSGDTSGTITVSAPAVSGSNTQTLVATTGTLAPIVSGTAITLTNQTAPEFTGIPSWVKRITVMLSGLSTNGTGVAIIQLGDSGGYETSGYTGATNVTSSAATTTSVLTTGIPLYGSFAAAQTLAGSVVLSLLDATTNTWAASVNMGRTDASSAGYGGYAKSLSATLDRLRLYVDGTQQFDAGTINILYE